MKGYEGFKVKTRRVLLGKGPEIYAKAKKKMVNWELNDAVPWCNFLEGEHGASVGSFDRLIRSVGRWLHSIITPLLTPLRPQPAGINVVSRIRCYGLFWTMNPLRKVLCHEKPWGKHGSVAAVAVSTLQGHLLEGTYAWTWTCPLALVLEFDGYPTNTQYPHISIHTPIYTFNIKQGRSASPSATRAGGTGRSGSTCSPSPRAAFPSAAS